ncbi:glycosyltransferase family 87 protein [Thermanaerothrix sp. 4228-RoL]|uniref:Glycosyltransferase family 87 protein n=2 Tax=Thermanaerothrix TaxID=1077886 RepID=A0ABU3NNX1_9CHLR|nr:glycosyltransferase family 87 protein [Thermanaerothrix sp. 4228-RoL]MDT8898541.1 glycosyltransferase family 87 protein [Thermanaerothrix sp. 4228-RoL]
MTRPAGNAIHIHAQMISQRLSQKIRLTEWLGVILAFAILAVFVLHQSEAVYPVDLKNYLDAERHTLQRYYYLPIWLPMFELLARLPLNVAWLIWGVLNILGFWFAWRVFGGGVWAWFTATLFFVIFYGQITGILAAGVAVFWMALLHDRWLLAGIGACIALTKYQWGLPLLIILAFLARRSKRTYFLTTCVTFAIIGIFLSLYPEWLSTLGTRYSLQPPNDQASISLWRYVGPVSLILWGIPFLLPLNDVKRLNLLFLSIPLVTPYFQPHDLLVWFAFPLGIWPTLSNLTFVILPHWGLSGLRWLALIPLMLYIYHLVHPSGSMSLLLLNPASSVTARAFVDPGYTLDVQE